MGQFTGFSCGGVRNHPTYLIILSNVAKDGDRGQLDLALQGMPLEQRDSASKKLNSDYDAIRSHIDEPYLFRVHGAFTGVPREVVGHTTEHQLAERARPEVSDLVQRVAFPDPTHRHFGDIIISGALPAIDEQTGEVLPEGDEYKIMPFSESLQRYPGHTRFHIPYDISLDSYGFRAWVLYISDGKGDKHLISLLDDIGDRSLSV